MISEAFFQVCKDAKPAGRSYVSLYADVPYYGGPEEGGWWGSDRELVAYHECTTEEEAEAVRDKAIELSEQLSKEARDNFHRHCAAQCDWLEARGLDSDYLPEVDGEASYSVMIEDSPGSHAYRGSRRYE